MSDNLTPELVTSLLREHLDPSGVCTTVQRGPVGNGQEVWFVSGATESGPVELVLRRTAESGPLDWTDRKQEYGVLERLAGCGLPIPEPVWFGEGGALVRPYFVMQRLPGGPVRRERPEIRARLADELGTLLARLHSSKAGRVESIQSGGDHTRAALLTWKERYERARPTAIPVLGALFAWLEANQPDDDTAAVTLWGDPGPHNVLHADGAITGLLDWELSRPGHPLEDLGAAVWSAAGNLNAEHIVGAYEEEIGRSIDREKLRYFEAMAAVTRAVMLVTGIANYIDGATRSPSLAGLGLYLLPRTLLQGASAAGWPESDSISAAQLEHSSPQSAVRPDLGEILEGVASFLAHDVLPATEDPSLRRGLKVATALLETAHLRLFLEESANGTLAVQRASFLAELDDSPIDTSMSLEMIAAETERDPKLAEWRPRVRQYLLTELAVHQALIEPLRRLFEGERPGPVERGESNAN